MGLGWKIVLVETFLFFFVCAETCDSIQASGQEDAYNTQIVWPDELLHITRIVVSAGPGLGSSVGHRPQ